MKRQPISRRTLLAGSAALAATTLSGQPSIVAKPLLKQDPALPGRTRNTAFAVNLEMWFSGPMEQRVMEAAKLGFPAVEFWPYQDRNIPAIAKVLKEQNMTAAQFTCWPFGQILNHPEKDAKCFLAAVEESCAIADQLPGCELFTVVAGNDIDGLSNEEMHAAVIAKLKQAVPILEKHKKTIILEPMNPYNHAGHCLYGSRDGIAICREVGSEWVKLNWDFFHMQRYEGNLIDNLRKGKDYIGYIQLADSPDRNEPGTGEVNYTEVFKVIREIGYDLPVGLECFPEDGDVVRAAQRIHDADEW